MTLEKKNCFENDKQYNRFIYNFDFDSLKKLEILNEKKNFYELLLLYFTTYIIVAVGIYLTSISFFFYFITIFFIAGRQGAFLQLIHDASHNLISKNSKKNDFFGEYLVGYPIGVNFLGFRSGHNNHHSNTATVNDSPSDLDKYLDVNYKKFNLYYSFLKDLLGVSAIKVFFSYNSTNKALDSSFFSKKKVLSLVKIASVQLFILLLFRFNILNYFLFWVYPLVGPHMFLMRIRGMAEHGQSNQLGCVSENNSAGTFYTRSFLTHVDTYSSKLLYLLEKVLIGSYNVNYHHEHHLFPNVPWYNLPSLSQKISDKIKKLDNSKVYNKGYLAAAFNQQETRREGSLS
jgi:fatty acid desaturase